MAAMTREEARALIADLRKDNGALSKRALELLEKECPRDFEAVQSIRRKLGASTRRLATDLYSKDTRYIYELIQNAEDNTYSRASARGEEPFLRFTLYTDRIVIDSNEDGFLAEHVKAICSTAESSKTSSGYIGEKGIGFKSVFKVARKVHIQSEPFSFSFEHDHESDDDGLGMVTPIQEEFENRESLPANVQTRITLVFNTQTDFETRVADLRALPDTLLLFLKNLRELSIRVQHPNGKTSSAEIKHKSDREKNMETILIDIKAADGTEVRQRDRFLVFRRIVTNLPYDASRKKINDATVVLAFPIDILGEPRLHKQHVFAFLPLRKVGFKFLIQCDFITQANREDVFDNSRNRMLLEGVAQTFRDAVLNFIRNNTLEYTWMRFLPDDSVYDEFWSTLVPRIQQLIRETQVLRSWTNQTLYEPTKLRYLCEDARDAHGEALFMDINPECYLSRLYQYSDFELLQSVECSKTTWEDIFDRVAADLRSANSRMKSPETSQEWHSRAAKLLSEPFETGQVSISSKLKSLAIVPLSADNWVSINNSKVYFQENGPCEIPLDIEIAVVDEIAVRNDSRHKFFTHLGVVECPPKQVVQAIYRSHGTSAERRLVAAYVHHLRYLYFHSETVSQLGNGLSLRREMTFAVTKSDDRKLVQQAKVCEKRIYLYGTGKEHDPENIFQAKSSPDVPGLSVWLLHDAYRADSPSTQHGLPWTEWLEQVVGILRIPPPQEADGRELSAEFKYLAKYRSDMLLQLLKQNWAYYTAELPKWRSELGKCHIRSKEGPYIAMNQAYAPTKLLAEKARQYNLDERIFLPIDIGVEDEHLDWTFLEQFGVRFGDDLEFYLQALQALCSLQPALVSPSKIFEVYAGLQKSADSDSARALLKSYKEDSIIFIPLDEPRWASLNECRWDGPDWFSSKPMLSSIPSYREHAYLFVNILGLKKVDHHDVRSELKAMKNNNSKDLDGVKERYRYLHRQFEKDKSSDVILKEFETNALVFFPQDNRWIAPSECVWADEKTALPGKASISSSYVSLKDFFHGMLRIPKPSIAMHVSALKQLAETGNPEEIKKGLFCLSALQPVAHDLDSLQKVNLFSVRGQNGNAQLTNSESDWLVPDHNKYREAFSAYPLLFLDYTPREIQTIRSLLISMNMEKKFLTTAVEETTKIEEGHLNPRLTKRMRDIAYALCRCAVHFSGPRRIDVTELFDILANVEIWTTDNMVKSIEVYQYGERYIVDGSRSDIHVDRHLGNVRIHVPDGTVRQNTCYLKELPDAILKILGVHDIGARVIVQPLLSTNNLDVVDDFLSCESISEVVGIDRPTAVQSSPFDALVYTPETSIPDSPTRSERVFASSYAGHSVSRSTPSRASASVSPERSASVQRPMSERGYVSVLSHVIAGALQAYIPASNSAFRAFASQHHGSLASVSQLAFQSNFERDMSVGAAGELFAFEFLTNLALPGFGRENWRSRIRDRVCVHEKYTLLAPWRGRETSDIVYDDIDGALLNLLVQKGYFLRESVTASPKFYLEVKTTTAPCSEVFYVSPNQYSLMQNCRLQAGVPAAEVMVILRVFNLDDGNLGMRIFVDPDAHRRNGTLQFSIEKYSVQALA